MNKQSDAKGDILRINYKKEKDGFQRDCICVDGYTYCFFHNHDAPKIFIEMEIYPLHAKVHALYEHLPAKARVMIMDHLYMSAKLCR